MLLLSDAGSELAEKEEGKSEYPETKSTTAASAISITCELGTHGGIYKLPVLSIDAVSSMALTT